VRKVHLIGALVGALVLALAAVAVASPQFKQTASLKYTTKKAQKPAGVSAELHATDPGAVPAGAQPGVRTLKINFKGSKANTKVGTLCKLPKDQADRCKANTKVGQGTASANLVGTNPTTGQPNVVVGLAQTVAAYQTTGGFYFVVKGVDLPSIAILKATLSKTGVLGVNVERDLPPLPGGNKIVLTDFEVAIKKVTTGRGSKQKALITTPKCPRSKKFSVVAAFKYSDGTAKTVTSKQACRS
jgi:hypothetical protein